MKACNMSLKFHFMDSHLNFFPVKMCDVSDEHDHDDHDDEHGERFHQEISEMESRYKGKPSPSLFADYCWTLEHDSKSSRRSVMKLFSKGKTILYTYW